MIYAATRDQRGIQRTPYTNSSMWSRPFDAVIATVLVIIQGTVWTVALPASLQTGPTIPDFEKLECAMHQMAFEWGTSKVPYSPEALHDALMLSTCNGHTDAATIEKNKKILCAIPPARSRSALRSASRTLYVATNGNDASGDGSESEPFATLHAAASALRDKPTSTERSMVIVKGGKYYMNSTLTLGAKDSNVQWAAAEGERVTLSGGKRLELQWEQYQGKILKAVLSPEEVLSAPEMEHLMHGSKALGP